MRIVYVVSLCIVIGTVVFTVKHTYNKYTKPMDVKDDSDVVVVKPMGTSKERYREYPL